MLLIKRLLPVFCRICEKMGKQRRIMEVFFSAWVGVAGICLILWRACQKHVSKLLLESCRKAVLGLNSARTQNLRLMKLFGEF